jgi:hypothetical protein
MSTINWTVLESKFWKPEIGKEYVLTVTNWRNDTTTYGRTNEPKNVLSMDVIREADAVTGAGKEFTMPKVFSEDHYTFINAIKPIIDRAEKEGKTQLHIGLKKEKDATNNRVRYIIYTFTIPAIKGYN